MIGRKLHNERRRLAGEHLRLLQNDTRADNACKSEEVGARRNPWRSAENRSRDQSDERCFRAAGDERRRDDRHAAVPFAFNRARRHDARHAATRTDKNRNKTLAGKTELAEQAVEHKRDSRHIAAGLQKRQ